jgi:Protein of unknown function (DUF2844)
MKINVTSLLILILAAAPGWAVLGESESSVTLDQQVLHGRVREEARSGYKLHQITTPDGGMVKEFVSPAGLVFGVAWQGPRMPNLQQLLGSHVGDLETALQSQTHGRGRAPFSIRTDKLVFASGGHMRAYHGYAYVPQLVPANVSPEAVQ